MIDVRRGVALVLLCLCLNASHAPRLIGFDCVGVASPVYADEEDHFPLCRAIERVGV